MRTQDENGPLWRRERAARRLDKTLRRMWKRSVPTLKTIGLVELTAIPMPEWARKKAVKGLTLTDSSVWLRRIAANFLARMDREAGGSPGLTTTEYRRCRLCGQPLLGPEAVARWELDRKIEGHRLPCSPACLEMERARKDRRAAQ